MLVCVKLRDLAWDVQCSRVPEAETEMLTCHFRGQGTLIETLNNMIM